MRTFQSPDSTMSFNSVAMASLLMGAAAAVSPSAWAYFPGKVEANSAELKQQPRPDAITVKTLPKGTSFNASDKPTNGYYYIRTATDLGWVNGASIGKAPLTQSRPQQKSATQQQQQQHQTKRATRKRTRVVAPYVVKLHADYNIFSVSDLNTATRSTSFGNVLGFGGEALYFFDPLTAVGIRIDSIGQKVSAADTSTSSTYDFSLSTLAIMVGAQRILWEDESFYISGNGYLGLASSKLSVNETTATATQTFEFSGKPLTFLALLEGGWKINPTFSLFGELGYRFLNSSNAPLTGSDPTGTIVPSTVSLNFSGPVIGIGASARF
ncbi:MAG: hypothetical protein ACJ763_18675 [Bdellovibrionia bacterium]